MSLQQKLSRGLVPLAGAAALALQSGCVTQSKYTAQDLRGKLDQKTAVHYQTSATVVSNDMPVAYASQRAAPSLTNLSMYAQAGIGGWKGSVYFGQSTNGVKKNSLDLYSPWNMRTPEQGTNDITAIEALDRVHEILSPYTNAEVYEINIGSPGQRAFISPKAGHLGELNAQNAAISMVRVYDYGKTNNGIGILVREVTHPSKQLREQRSYQITIKPGVGSVEEALLTRQLFDGAYLAQGSAATLGNGLIAGGLGAGVTAAFEVGYWGVALIEGHTGNNKIAPGTSLNARFPLAKSALEASVEEMAYTFSGVKNRGASDLLFLPYKNKSGMIAIEGNGISEVHYNTNGTYTLHAVYIGDHLAPKILLEMLGAGVGKVLCDSESDSQRSGGNGLRSSGGRTGAGPGGNSPPGQNINGVTPGLPNNPPRGVGGR